MVLIIISLTLIWYFRASLGFIAAPKYTKFGANLPAGFSVHGIDVSHHQGIIDWNEVAKMRIGSVRISFAYLKATEGVTLLDSKYKRNKKGALTAGIPTGAYHYFIPWLNPEAQAKHFMQAAKPISGDLAPVIDIEEAGQLSPLRLRKALKACLAEVEKICGVKPVIYTYLHFYNTYLKGDFKDYTFWVAHYYKPYLKVPDEMQWVYWQHSDKGTVNGIRTRTDLNVFRGDSLEFSQILIP